MTFAVFAEPALLMVIFTLALLAGTTNLDTIAELLREGSFGLRVSLGLAAVAFVAVALTETGRIPVDNPATHLELTMVHEAMVLEYSGRDLALIDGAAMLKLLLWFTLIGTVFVPFGAAPSGAGPLAWLVGLVLLGLEDGRAGGGARRAGDGAGEDAGVPGARVPRHRPAARAARGGVPVRQPGLRLMPPHMGFGVLAYDAAHMLGGAVLVLSFALLYQRRLIPRLVDRDSRGLRGSERF